MAKVYLAFDFGTQRVGVASGNGLMKYASPLTTIDKQGDERFAAIAALIDEWQPDELVVGVPRYPDGNAHQNTARAQRFARQLYGRTSLVVHEVDERYSTVEAASKNAGRASPLGDIDAVSAAVILQQFLDNLP
jgi:putative Holliday junction resolvase